MQTVRKPKLLYSFVQFLTVCYSFIYSLLRFTKFVFLHMGWRLYTICCLGNEIPNSVFYDMTHCQNRNKEIKGKNSVIYLQINRQISKIIPVSILLGNRDRPLISASVREYSYLQIFITNGPILTA